MKKILSFLFIVGLLISCDPKPEIEPDNKLDPNAMIVIRPANGVKLRSTFTNLTALEIVQQATSIQFQTQYLDDVDQGYMKIVSRAFNEETMKDFTIPALLMLGIDVINAQGEYIRDFTHAKSIYITKVDNTGKSDTLAYIPDEVVDSARILIEKSFADGDYEGVYRLFNEAYTFVPITSE